MAPPFEGDSPEEFADHDPRARADISSTFWRIGAPESLDEPPAPEQPTSDHPADYGLSKSSSSIGSGVGRSVSATIRWRAYSPLPTRI